MPGVCLSAQASPLASTASLLPGQCPLGGAAQHRLEEAGPLPAAAGNGSGLGERRGRIGSVSILRLPACETGLLARS